MKDKNVQVRLMSTEKQATWDCRAGSVGQWLCYFDGMTILKNNRIYWVEGLYVKLVQFLSDW